MYTERSKIDGRVSVGVLSKHPPFKLSYRPPSHSGVFQAEVSAIITAAIYIETELRGINIFIFSNRQRVVKSRGSLRTVTKILLDYRKSLEELFEQNRLFLFWVSGHRDIEGNCKAGEPADSS